MLREVERWPEWAPTVTSVRRLDGGARRRAAGPDGAAPDAPGRVRGNEFAPGRSFTWVATGPGVRTVRPSPRRSLLDRRGGEDQGEERGRGDVPPCARRAASISPSGEQALDADPLSRRDTQAPRRSNGAPGPRVGSGQARRSMDCGRAPFLGGGERLQSGRRLSPRRGEPSGSATAEQDPGGGGDHGDADQREGGAQQG
ncbi:hypothetical protein [Geodermatophilus amargosae]|uniref:hypothetical protein n=1 Tax=Geodermatophilus amargosae TaxID=1296565 RepID=UPI000B1B1C7A